MDKYAFLNGDSIECFLQKEHSNQEFYTPENAQLNEFDLIEQSRQEKGQKRKIRREINKNFY